MLHQADWPKNRNAVDSWARHYEIAVGRMTGDFGALLDQAEAMMRATGTFAVPRSKTATKTQVNYRLGRPEGLLQAQVDWTVEVAEEAFERLYKTLRHNERLTLRRYQAWPPGANRAPSASPFEQWGGFGTVRDRVARRLGRL